jgi:hypothetical protein
VAEEILFASPTRGSLHMHNFITSESNNKKHKQEIAGGAASARGNCANMTRRRARGWREAGEHRRRRRIASYPASDEIQNAQRARCRPCFVLSIALYLYVYARAFSSVCVCVNTRRCWRDLCAAATMQTQPAESTSRPSSGWVKIKTTSRAKVHSATHTISISGAKKRKFFKTRVEKQTMGSKWISFWLDSLKALFTTKC